jgi:hypothetical protein
MNRDTSKVDQKDISEVEILYHLRLGDPPLHPMDKSPEKSRNLLKMQNL